LGGGGTESKRQRKEREREEKRKKQKGGKNKYDNYIYHRTWQILTANVFHKTHDVHKITCEHSMCWNLKINLNDITLKGNTHTSTHIKQNIYGVKSSILYYTHHRDKDTPHYVYDDVLSDVPLALMFHYTHHRCLDTTHYINSMHTLMLLHYTCVNECFVTHITENMDAPQYV
jgi:hypothetical protein